MDRSTARTEPGPSKPRCHPFGAHSSERSSRPLRRSSPRVARPCAEPARPNTGCCSRDANRTLRLGSATKSRTPLAARPRPTRCRPNTAACHRRATDTSRRGRRTTDDQELPCNRDPRFRFRRGYHRNSRRCHRQRCLRRYLPRSRRHLRWMPSLRHPARPRPRPRLPAHPHLPGPANRLRKCCLRMRTRAEPASREPGSDSSTSQSQFLRSSRPHATLLLERGHCAILRNAAAQSKSAP